MDINALYIEEVSAPTGGGNTSPRPLLSGACERSATGLLLDRGRFIDRAAKHKIKNCTALTVNQLNNTSSDERDLRDSFERDYRGSRCQPIYVVRPFLHHVLSLSEIFSTIIGPSNFVALCVRQLPLDGIG